MNFSKFFSTINFSYQYLQEAKAYLEPSRTSTLLNSHFAIGVLSCKFAAYFQNTFS